MKIFSVNYDLNTPGQRYDGLGDRVSKHYPDRVKALKSTWLIRTGDSAHDVYRKLSPALDSNDRILINRVTHEHTGWLSKDVVAWLENRMQQAA
jgi:hypothetical protein